MSKISYALKGLMSEVVRNGDVASGVKCVWNVLFIVLEAFYFHFSLRPPLGTLKVQCSNSNTKVSRGQVYSLSEGPTRGLGVRLTCI